MKLILTHAGSDLPAYVEFCLKQLRRWNGGELRIIFLMSSDYIGTDRNNYWFNSYDVDPYPYEELKSDRTAEFYNLSWYHVWGTPNTKYPSPPNFVQGTSERLFHLAAYCEKFGIENAYHIENDIMMYESFAQIDKVARKCYDELTATVVGPNDMACALMYIPQPKHITKACDFILRMMAEGNNVLLQKYPEMGMVHEMTILRKYEYLQYFPSLPRHRYYEDFRSLFDPASWGQYIGGTNNFGNGVGWAGNHHYIGQEILARRFSARMERQNGVYIPYAISNDGNSYKLNNLHIHCKELEKFLS